MALKLENLKIGQRICRNREPHDTRPSRLGECGTISKIELYESSGFYTGIHIFVKWDDGYIDDTPYNTMAWWDLAP